MNKALQKCDLKYFSVETELNSIDDVLSSNELDDHFSDNSIVDDSLSENANSEDTLSNEKIEK